MTCVALIVQGHSNRYRYIVVYGENRWQSSLIKVHFFNYIEVNVCRGGALQEA